MITTQDALNWLCYCFWKICIEVCKEFPFQKQFNRGLLCLSSVYLSPLSICQLLWQVCPAKDYLFFNTISKKNTKETNKKNPLVCPMDLKLKWPIRWFFKEKQLAKLINVGHLHFFFPFFTVSPGAVRLVFCVGRRAWRAAAVSRPGAEYTRVRGTEFIYQISQQVNQFWREEVTALTFEGSLYWV